MVQYSTCGVKLSTVQYSILYTVQLHYDIYSYRNSIYLSICTNDLARPKHCYLSLAMRKIFYLYGRDRDYSTVLYTVYSPYFTIFRTAPKKKKSFEMESAEQFIQNHRESIDNLSYVRKTVLLVTVQYTVYCTYFTVVVMA